MKLLFLRKNEPCKKFYAFSLFLSLMKIVFFFMFNSQLKHICAMYLRRNMHSAACPSTQKRFVWRYFWLILTVTIKDRTYCWTVGHSKFLKRHVERQTRGLKEWKYEKLSEYVVTMNPCVSGTICVCWEREREREYFWE